MRYIIIISILASLCGCKPHAEDRGALEIPTDFKQITKYPELTDNDYTNGHVSYRIKDKDDIVTVCIYGVVDESQIESVVSELKFVIKQRNITPHLVAKIYDDLAVIDEDNLKAGKLINTIEVKDF